jgi:GR25 family glycosyltransferase involved in LPS biosynthesis
MEYIFNNYKIFSKIYVNNDSSNINKINNLEIYIINLRNNITRKKYIEIIMKKKNINYNLITVNFPKSTNEINELLKKKNIKFNELGCLLSHLWCLNDYMTRNTNNYLLILEDDIVFHNDFHDLFNKIYNTIINDNIDFLMLGASDMYFAKTNSKVVSKEKNIYKPISKCHYLLGAHANIYNKNVAEFFFKFKINNCESFDYNYDVIFKNFNAYICCPNLVCAELSTSNLNHYDSRNLKKKQDYYYLCFNNFNFNDYHFLFLCFFTKLQNIVINDEDTVKDIIYKLLVNFFNKNSQYIEYYKNKMDYNFYSKEDILYLMNL